MRSKKRNSPETNTNLSICYCDGSRKLGTLELHCALCRRWFHQSCLKDLKEFYGLPFMVSYVFNCRECAPEKKETWALKQTNFSHMCIMALANMTYDFYYQKMQNLTLNEDKTISSAAIEEAMIQEPKKYFKMEAEILPFFELNWENLTSQPRRVKNTWHQTLNKTLSKEVELFESDPNDENSFALKEKDLLMIGPLHEAVKMLGKRPTQSITTTTIAVWDSNGASTPCGVDEKSEKDGPKTRGASKRKVADINSSGAQNLTSKKNKTGASDFFSVQIDGLETPVDFPFNREGYRYYLTEKDDNVPNRVLFDQVEVTTAKAIPGHIYRIVHNPVVKISPNDRAYQLKLSEDLLTVTGQDGYCVCRSTHSVAHGSWYYEVDFVAQPDESHTRIGWGQAYSVLQACLGYTKFSYSWRSLNGTKFHEACGKHYANCGYKQGDTLGCLIELPELDQVELLLRESSSKSEQNDFTFSDFLPPSHKDKPLIDFKHNLFYEEKEEVQEAIKKLKPIKGSRIEFFLNGSSCGTAYADIYAGHYYPALSCFRAATLHVNFGPTFKYPPPQISPYTMAKIRPIAERAEQIHVEQAMSDILYLVAEEKDIAKKTKDFFENS